MERDVDIWDLKSCKQPERITENTNTVIGQRYQRGVNYARAPKITTAIGSMSVSINTDIKIWKLKLIKTGHSYWSFNFIVGLISSEQIQNEANFRKLKDTNDAELFKFGYTLDLYSGKFKSAISQPPVSKIWNDLTIFEEDVINIRYRTITRRNGTNQGTKVGILSFALNNGKWMRGFSDIPINDNQKYKLALQLRNDEMIQLIQ